MNLTTYPDRATWLAARRLGLGGSDVPAVLGLSPWRTPLQVWTEKVGLAEEAEDSYTLRRGAHMEPLLWRELESEVDGLRAVPQYRATATGAEPWMRYSPDAFISLGNGGLAWDALGEGKSHPRGASEWDEEAPPHVVAQVQWGMFVCDLPAAYVAVDLGTEFRWTRVERDPAWWPAHEAALRAFWSLVETETPPAPTGDEGDRAAIAAMYPTAEPGTCVPLDAGLLDVTAEIVALTEQKKKLDREIEERRNRIRLAIGAAEEGVLPDGGRWRNRTTRRAGYQVAAAEFRALTYVNAKER